MERYGVSRQNFGLTQKKTAEKHQNQQKMDNTMKAQSFTTEVETQVPAGQFIYSRTDLKGKIVEANQAFVDISGYSREEMIGQPHNLVRHPDMPSEAFADMWRDLKSGRPWRGIVKNRRKDGGFYWVVANASPVREEGKIVGYQSVRTRPTVEDVMAAKAAYQRLQQGDRSIRVFHGRVVPKRRSLWALFCCSEVQPWLLSGSCLLFTGLFLLRVVLGWTWLDKVLPILATLLLTITLFFMLVFMPAFQKGLQQLTDYLETLLLSGDLTKRFDLQRQDPLGIIARKVDRFVSSVQATIQCMGDAARQVRDIANEVEQGMTQVHVAAQQQNIACSSAAHEISAVTRSIADVANSAGHTCQVSASAKQSSEAGSVVAHQASQTIVYLADAVKASAQQVEQLGQESEEISRITAVIKDIAEQTNLLALNAAIEAARAGETGRGFAVVADEVRKLAERTSMATEDISRMVQAVQQETVKAVAGMRSGAQHVEQGVQLVEQAKGALHDINQKMQTTTERVSEISFSAQQQNQAVHTLEEHLGQIAVMTEQNRVVVSSTSDTVAHLNKMVLRMEKSVTQYRVKG